MLTSSDSYVDALERLRTEPLIAPVYYITAGSGPGEGAVLTRERSSCHPLWMLGEPNNNTLEWYLLQTNYVSGALLSKRKREGGGGAPALCYVSWG